MRRPALQITAALALLATTALGTPTQDLTNLRTSCNNVTGVLFASVNQTEGVDTAYLLQSIGYQIGACLTNAGCIGTTVPPITSNDSLPAGEDNLDEAYLNYTGGLSSLAIAVIARGRALHAELNEPVSHALAGVANAVYAYGSCLSNGNLISPSASIRTWRAGSNLVEAESAWNQDQNYPSRRRVSRGRRVVEKSGQTRYGPGAARLGSGRDE